MKYYDLNDGNRIPALGFGTYKIVDEALLNDLVEVAFEAGYEYLDTAKFYENEKALGLALKNSPKKRGDYQIATKVWPSDFGTDETRRSLDQSLKDLGLDYLDVALLHRYGRDFDKAWEVFCDYKRQGIIKTIGVCNFTRPQLEELYQVGDKPAIDQLESSPHFENKELFDYLKEEGILHQARSPLTQGRSGLLDEEVLKELGEKYGKSPAQIAIKWNIQRGGAVLAKSKTPSRIRENIDIFDFDLTEDDFAKIRKIDKNKRYSHDPEDRDRIEEISK